jgi:crotonobetainyl-CoA:carnitine CoA-transferase CaiB-like acyl-CoA transferase
MVSLLSFQAVNYFASGKLPPRTGNDHGIASPYGMFRTKDGQVAIAPSNDTFYFKVLDALDLQHLREHPDLRPIRCVFRIARRSRSCWKRARCRKPANIGSNA